MHVKRFVSELSSLGFADTFNPYSDRCEVMDDERAPHIRRVTLTNVLELASRAEVHSMWIGRDLGYRGGRRTGLALTDDVHLSEFGKRWGYSVQRPTVGEPFAERTAAIIWNILRQIPYPIFLWNVFPLHPHLPHNPFSNRAHNAVERHAGEEILSALVMQLRPKNLVAIGQDAAKSARKIAFALGATNPQVIEVRHPSYGGHNIFKAQMCDFYGLCESKLDASRNATYFGGSMIA